LRGAEVPVRRLPRPVRLLGLVGCCSGAASRGPALPLGCWPPGRVRLPVFLWVRFPCRCRGALAQGCLALGGHRRASRLPVLGSGALLRMGPRVGVRTAHCLPLVAHASPSPVAPDRVLWSTTPGVPPSPGGPVTLVHGTVSLRGEGGRCASFAGWVGYSCPRRCASFTGWAGYSGPRHCESPGGWSRAAARLPFPSTSFAVLSWTVTLVRGALRASFAGFTGYSCPRHGVGTPPGSWSPGHPVGIVRACALVRDLRHSARPCPVALLVSCLAAITPTVAPRAHIVPLAVSSAQTHLFCIPLWASAAQHLASRSVRGPPPEQGGHGEARQEQGTKGLMSRGSWVLVAPTAEVPFLSVGLAPRM
jgi:hypothetical protein